MRTADVDPRYALTIVTAIALAACSGPQPPIGTPGAMQQTRALAGRTDNTNYKVVHRFHGSPDGGDPAASLIDVGGTLYGTTFAGGTNGEGTVFIITLSGTERVLYSFGKNPDGNGPGSGLVDVSGTLYGTTEDGGAHYCAAFYTNCGTVFSITAAGTENVLHSFRGGPHDGNGPVAPLVDVKGAMYGTTEYGGRYCLGTGLVGCGTVFSISRGGAERILHSFGGPPDGAYPGGLVEVNGTLYGTTNRGGANGDGAVFSITPDGTEKVLHSFGPYSHSRDGSYPVGSLAVLGGVLYGTTENGGRHHLGGTVFSITTGGAEKVLHSFHWAPDGANPASGLVDVAGTLYGTTQNGGAYLDRGTIFSITPAGAEKVLHSFGNGTDGSFPAANMYYEGGSLLGTTTRGGIRAGVHGKGTVFSLTP
ncbi:MAG TPA: choice-of-anchor tandem repeat GloVer-containing protein [Candidatus Cybelea sp.]|nr:choice-of-anchor tandem repeat GloVer-containing protein [Candidatus Cybelea sp.]